MVTKKDLLGIIKGLRGNAELVLEVVDSDGEPYSAFVSKVYVNELGQIVFTDTIS